MIARAMPAAEAWRLRALCRGVDPDLFFPPHHGEDHAQAAKAICAACPVRVHCATTAIVQYENHGIWGGFGYRERLRIARYAKDRDLPVAVVVARYVAGRRLDRAGLSPVADTG